MFKLVTGIFSAIGSFLDAVDEARALRDQMANKYKHLNG